MKTKRILILTEATDITADKVCQWLHYYKTGFLRLNTDIEDVWVDGIDMDGTSVTIRIGHHSGVYNLDSFHLIWFRRGQLISKVQEVANDLFPEDELINTQINNHLQQELRVLNEFIYRHIPKTVATINNPSRYNINKLECLYEAAKRGLKTPTTWVTHRKEQLVRVRHRRAVITKNISDILICHSDRFFMSQSTMTVRDKDVDRANARFFPSLFQETIYKKADIRVFFFLGRIFSTAVYSPMNADQIDFRAANNIVVVPYALPVREAGKLLDLAESLGLESGSADFLLDKKDNLTFLEINPVGQIDFVSHLSNLYIEKEIAKMIIEYGTVSAQVAHS